MANRTLLKYLENWLIPLLIIFTAAFMRLIPHTPNFTPIGALALFSGAKVEGKMRFVFPLLAMFSSDLILGFHSTMFFVYSSFILIVLLGQLLKQRNSLSLTLVTISASLVFFFITNFGVWFISNMYPKTSSGLVETYIMGLPFLRNTIAGDFIYSFTFFYGFDLINNILYKFLPKVKVG